LSRPLNFINDWCGNKGRHLDVLLNMHNIECNEGPNSLFPLHNPRQISFTSPLSKQILNKFEKDNFIVHYEYWMIGWDYSRFGTWCASIWGTLHLPFEFNSQYPKNRLSLCGLNKLGMSLANGLAEYFNTEDYERALINIDYSHDTQTKRRDTSLIYHEQIKDEDLTYRYSLIFSGLQ